MKRLFLGGLSLLAAVTAQAGDNPFVEEIFEPPTAYEQDPPVSGKMAGDNCSACHGTQGRTFNDVVPPLAGLPKDQFVAMMQRFKRGDRPSLIMNEVARAFTDGEIERMGEYFAEQPAKPWLETTK